MSKSGNIPPNDSGRERTIFQTFYSSTYTNSDLAAKRNLAKESAKKNTSYSNRMRSLKQASVPSAEATTSDRSWEGNHSKFTGSGKGKKGTKGILLISHSKHLLHRVNKEERIECIDPNCGFYSHCRFFL